MEEANQVRTMAVNSDSNSNFFIPTKKIMRYLTLQDCENEMFLLFYVLFLIASFTAILLAVIKRTVLLTVHDVYQDLCKAIMDGNIIKCFAIIRKHPQTINMICGNSRYTPFLRACLKGNTQLVKFMISQGADIHMKSLNGEGAFYLATYHHIKCPDLVDASCIHTLYHAGVNINEPNSKGLTPLQLAAYFGHYKLVRWLLKKGADTRLTPSPYVLAREQGHLPTALMLRNAAELSNNVL